MNSLRIRLISLFGLSIIIAAAVQFATSFYAARNEANKLFDYHMQQMTVALEDSDFAKVDFTALPGADNDNFDFVVQEWSADGMAVYQSHTYLELPKKAPLGYSNVTLGNGEWRIFAAKAHDRVVQIAQKMKVRENRAMSLALSALWPVIPVSLLLLIASGWLVTTALAPLDRISHELEQRNPDSLEPLAGNGVPREISSLVFALNSLLERMAQTLQFQQQFVADAAHELRSPITALRLQTQNLARSRDETTFTQAIARLLGGVDRAARVVEQLLVLARQNPSSHKPKLVPLSLNNCLEQAITDVTPIAASRQMQITFTTDVQIKLQGEVDSLRVLISNLLDNAIRYSPERGLIRLDLHLDGDCVHLCVQDSGKGIPIQERERIFDRFYRIPGTQPTGSGLGLAIVKTIADRHNAQIELDDAALGGLAVHIRFPHAEQMFPEHDFPHSLSFV
jgi:two-component system OmpR family sensor kinase